MKTKAVAFTDNDVVVIAWSFEKKPDGCMGFAIYRIDEQGSEVPLLSHAVFPGDSIKTGQTTKDFPVQKFYWKDPYARLVAEKSGSGKFRYRVVPLEGTPHHLSPKANQGSLLTDLVELTTQISPHVQATFNRGLISTQRVARTLAGHINSPGFLLDQVKVDGNPLRNSLAGDMLKTLENFVDRASQEGKIYAALYELGDEALIEKLEGLGNRLEIILSNSDIGDKPDPAHSNKTPRDRMHESAGVIWNRMLPNGHIGHNKFLIYVDKTGQPQAILFGSTNWTSTGLCTQTNNTLVIEDPALAGRYLEYWHKLAEDTQAANGQSKQLQAGPLRGWDGTSQTFTVDGSSIESWFSPNTPHQRGSKKTGELCPVDMAAVQKLISEKAQQAILFLAFDPGAPSIINWIAQAQKDNPQLFVRGCLTNQSKAGDYFYELKGQAPPPKIPGQKAPVKQDPRVIAAEAFDSKSIPEGWQREILAAGFAIVHDKIVVIDPFSDDCVVITGSHNLGYQASYNNSENLAIVTGNKRLAEAYTVHILDVYDHFSFRWMVKNEGEPKADQSLKTTPDKWMDKYFDTQGNIKNAQLKFWLSAG